MKLPVLPGLKIVKALGKVCFEVDHQTGSHFILRENKMPFRRVTVPNHKTIAPGTLLAIIKQAGLSKEEFLKLI
ncbi:MAG: type II toxin-antitoxin system HicA family toxin [Candidatus ainarchaeum sp.]|nr:type II toxin-antitoxin system HicA family toxin [Candidatus ainarchaeum sp.]